MVAALVISNPLLLLPQERAAIISYQTLQWEQSSQSALSSANTESPSSQRAIRSDIRIHYGPPFFLLLAFGALGLGFARKETRLKSSLILAWIIPLSISIYQPGNPPDALLAADHDAALLHPGQPLSRGYITLQRQSA